MPVESAGMYCHGAKEKTVEAVGMLKATMVAC